MRLVIYKAFFALTLLCGTSAISFAKYLCAINEVYECVAVTGCTRASVKNANLAGVMVLDIQKKQLSMAPLGGVPRTDDIDSLTVSDDAILLYGTGKRKADRTFSAVISLKSGNLSAGLSTLDSSFSMLGTCSSAP
jgi:hypothetical protein